MKHTSRNFFHLKFTWKLTSNIVKICGNFIFIGYSTISWMLFSWIYLFPKSFAWMPIFRTEHFPEIYNFPNPYFPNPISWNLISRILNPNILNPNIPNSNILNSNIPNSNIPNGQFLELYNKLYIFVWFINKLYNKFKK